MTLTLLRPPDTEFRDADFEDELLLQMRLAELIICVSECSARRAFRLVSRRGNESPSDRLARALTVTRSEIAAA